jgi:hypothetical protein
MTFKRLASRKGLPMKLILPIAVMGLLLWPLHAQAQGMGDPYSGTGANDSTGHISMTGKNAITSSPPDYAEQDPPAEDDSGNPVHTGSAYSDSFRPKDKSDDSGAMNLYDQSSSNLASQTERRRQAIIRKVEADQQKTQDDMKKVNEAHERQVKAYVAKTVRDSKRKANGDADTGDDDDADQQDQDQDQGAGGDDTSPDAVKE